MFLAKLLGSCRRLILPDYAEGEPGQTIALNSRGEALVSQGLPERAELVRLGSSWGAQIPTGSAFTFVAAWPTTRAELVLFNGEPATGKSYVIDRCWLSNITSEAAAQPYSLLGQLVSRVPALTAPTNNTAILKQALNGNKLAYTGNALLALANTSFCAANQWFPLGTGNESPMTTNLGASLEALCYGRYIVPPGAVFGLAGIAGTAAGTAILGVEWHEVQLPLG